ncbi:DUF4031 domain-containing protein [Kineococcus rhizosphaerae]|uniref:Uncharacterized protein DUF4031 n=1 Tax=Kineococcus rhizosphaerae TaxID=559628 RepID=A0A2T0R0R4_9ACTN|nr:DUF4031 domain-containing protein [Kineococcus rhizosphaerae]PRY12886.1 uncharacterized protein DUF4031 [Kineococcus rhizosphaerae]
MSVLVDTARVPAHGRWWAHLASDTSTAELHAFADRLGVPRRAFEGDHYDVPVERVPAAVDLGAELVTTRELIARLRAAGLRTPKRRGEKVLSTAVVDGHRIDVVRAATVPEPHGTHRLARRCGDGVLLGADGDLPVADRLVGPVAGFRRRWSRTAQGVDLRHDGVLLPDGPIPHRPPGHWWSLLLHQD